MVHTNKKFVRSFVCFFVSILILWRSNALFGVIRDTTGFDSPWFLPLVISLLSGFVTAFFPVNSLQITSLFIVIPSILFGFLEIVFIILLSWLVRIMGILLPLFLITSISYVLIYQFGYQNFGSLGASVATIVLVSIFISVIKKLFLSSFSISEFLGNVIAALALLDDPVILFPFTLARGVLEFATILGRILGGNIFNPNGTGWIREQGLLIMNLAISLSEDLDSSVRSISFGVLFTTGSVVYILLSCVILTYVNKNSTSIESITTPEPTAFVQTFNLELTNTPVESPGLPSNFTIHVTKSDVNIRSSANAETKKNIILSVPKGFQLSLTGNSVMVDGKEWFEVYLDDGRLGWVNGTFLE